MANSNNKCTGVKELDPVQGLVDYVNDIKPYHTKIVEVLIEYVYEEQVDVTILEDTLWDIEIARPSDPLATYACSDGYSLRPYGGSALWPIVTPNQSGTHSIFGSSGFTANSFSLPGNRAGDMLPGTNIDVIAFIEDYSNVYDIVGLGPNYFLVADPGSPATFEDAHPIFGGSPAGHLIEAYGTTDDDNRPFVITNIEPVGSPSSGITKVTVHQSVLSTVIGGKLGLVRTPHSNTGTYEIVQSVYSEGSIDAWPGYPDPGTYELGDDPHTVVTVSGTFIIPPTLPAGQFYVAFARLEPISIQQVMPYSNFNPTLTSSPLTYTNTPDEGLNRKEIIGVAAANPGSVIISGSWELSNVFVGNSIRILSSTGNNGTYTISNITYDGVLDQTTIDLAEEIVSAVADGIVQIDIPANTFVVDGNFTSRFVQGELFIVSGGEFAGRYTTLNSDYADGQTRIRVTRDIVDAGTEFDVYGSPPVEVGILRERVLGFGEGSDICNFTPEGMVRIKFDEQLTFDGLGLDLHDNVIAYNLENTDSWGYELPLWTIIDPVTPTITESATPPVSPDFNDLWFDTDNEKFFQWNNTLWKEITTAWWLEEGPMLLYYRTRNKFVDTGWVLFLAAPPGFSDSQPAVGKTISIGTQSWVVDPLGGSTFELTSLVVPSIGSPAEPDKSLITVTINGVPANFTLDSSTQFTLIPVPDWEEGDIITAEVFERTQLETNAFAHPVEAQPHQVFHNGVDVYPGSPQQNAYVLYGGNYVQRFTPDHTFDVWSFSGSPTGLLATQRATSFPIIDVDDELGTIAIEGAWDWLFEPGRIFSVRTSDNNYNDFEVDTVVTSGSPAITVISVTQPAVYETTTDDGTDPQWFYNPGVVVSINNVTDAITIEGSDVTSSFPSGMKVLISGSTTNNNTTWTVDTATYYPPVPGSPSTPAQTIVTFVEDVVDYDDSLNARVHTPIFQNYSRDLGVIVGAVYDPVVDPVGGTDQVKTFVVPSTTVETAVNGITYEWIGPLRIDLKMSPQDLVYTTMAQRLGATTANTYEIVAVDTGLNQFTIYYESLGSPPAPIDLTDSFNPGTQFFITGSYNRINNQSGFGGSPPEWPPLPWTVVSATFNGTETVITVAETITDDTVPYGRIQLEPLAVQPIVGGNYFNIIEANVFEEGSPLVPVRSRFGILGNQTGVFAAGEQIQVVASAGNDRMWTVTRVYYDGAGEEQLVAIQGSPANQFVISGFYQDKFVPGFEFSLYDDGGSPHNPNVKNYTTISSSYDGGLNQTTITVLGEIPNPTVNGDERIRFDGTDKTYLYVDASVIPVDQTTPLGRVVVENTTAGQVAAARFEENIDFGWGTTYQWPIVSVDVGLNEVVVSGDATHVLFALDPAGSPYDPNDVVSIVGSAGSPNNDGTYEVISHQYNAGTNTTTIVLDPPITVSTTSPGNGVLKVENIDITNWFQYLIKEALPERGSPPTPVVVFEVHGNATGDVQLGQQFRVMGTSNDGLYTVTSSPIYDALTNTTDVPVASISNNEKGGWIESARDFGIRLILEDTIGVSVAEDATGALLLTSGNVMDAWDYPYWDIGSWDESLGTVIHLYSNTF